jgi:hypothetical protein
VCIPLPILAGGVMAAGQLYSGLAANAQGKYEANVAEANAKLEAERARDSIERGRLEARDLYRDVGRVKGEQTAAMAANGIDLGYGTALRFQQDTAMLAQEDAENLYRNIHERTRGHDINASNFRAEAKAARQRGKAAMVGSVFSAAGSVAGGFQQQAAINADREGSLMGGFRQLRGMRVKLGRSMPRSGSGTPGIY